MFGMGKASTIRYIWQVTGVVESAIKPNTAKLPETIEEGNALCTHYC
jgi:hypothetical protein